MATWQFSVVLIPRSWAIENNYSSTLLVTEEGYDTEIAWKENQPNPEFMDILSKMLPPAKSWGNDLLCWGNEEENDIQVWFENKTIEGIHIRLDLNQNLNNIIANLVQTAKNLDCALFFPELKAVKEANEFELKRALKASRAAQFVKDPNKYLNDLQK